MADFTDEERRILDRVEKLMRLASNNPNEAERQSAAQKASELLAAYNLDASQLAAASGDTGKRAEEKIAGGFYQFERDLWRDIARLNFCWYFTTVHFLTKEERVGPLKHAHWQHRHVLIGRTVNVAATKAMATYMLQAIERVVKERLDAGKIHPRSKWAVSYRQGMAERLSEKVRARRREQMLEEERRADDARRAAAAAGRAGVSTATALTIASVAQSEHEANYDFVNGAGSYAKRQAAQAERAAAERRAAEDYTRWAADHPEEARKREAAAERERERDQRRRERRKEPEFKGDWGAFSAGYHKAENIGIDPQMKRNDVKRIG